MIWMCELIYRVGHFNSSRQITPVIAKNNSYKSCRIQREATVDDLELDLEVDFQSHFKINKYFFNGNPYFLSRIWKEHKILRKKYVPC